MAEEKAKQLQPEVAEKYDVIKVSIAKHHFNGWGVIDLRDLTLAQADALAAREFPWLKAKAAAPVTIPAPKTKAPDAQA